MSAFTLTQAEVLFAGPVANYTAAAASSAALQGLCVGATGNFMVPTVWAGFWPLSAGAGKLLSVQAAGIVTGQASATTMTVTAGLNSTIATAGSSSPAGVSIAASGAVTVTSLTAQTWWFTANINSKGAGFGTTTVSTSLSGFGVLNVAAATTGNGAPGGPTAATTIDASVNQFLYLGVTFSTSSTTNSCTLEQLTVLGMN